MRDFYSLRDFVIVLSIGFLGGFIARKLNLPLLLGYLLGGFAFTLFASSHFTFSPSLHTLSDIGISLLLFTLGVEFSLSNLQRVKNIAVFGGILQVLITIIVSLFFLPALGFSFGESLFLGSAFALSSTAIVAKIISEKGEQHTVHGEALIGILLMQDLIVIPLMIVLPHFLSSSSFTASVFMEILFSLIKAVVIIAATFFLGRTVVPYLLSQVVKLNSRELLLVSVVTLALGFAFLASLLDLPASIGAFLAGLLVSETLINHAVFSEVRPLRDIFTIIFFVLLGMFLSPVFFFQNIGLILLLFVFVIIAKSLIVFLLMLAFSYHTKTSFLVASSLPSVGEFAFILAGLFVTQDLIAPRLYNLILATSLLTFLLAPWQISFAPKMYRYFKKTIRQFPPLYNAIFGKLDYDRVFHTELPFEDHVVILGHGRVGRVVAKVLSQAGIPFVGVDFNLSVVEDLKRKGVPFVYGDPTDIEVLDFAQVDKARAVVVAVPDTKSAEIIIKNSKQLNPKVRIIVRAHFEDDKDVLLTSGAHHVVQPEYEAGLSIAHKALALFGAVRK